MFREEERYKKITWKEIRVGDVLHLSNNEVVPADVLLLRSSDEHGACYLDTCNLDGESSLKLRSVPQGYVEKVNMCYNVSVYSRMCFIKTKIKRKLTNFFI